MVEIDLNRLFATPPQKISDPNRGKKIEVIGVIETFLPDGHDNCTDISECLKKSDKLPLGKRVYYHQKWVRQERCECGATGFTELHGYSF